MDVKDNFSNAGMSADVVRRGMWWIAVNDASSRFNCGHNDIKEDREISERDVCRSFSV